MDKALEAFIMKAKYDIIHYTQILTHKTWKRLQLKVDRLEKNDEHFKKLTSAKFKESF